MTNNRRRKSPRLTSNRPS